MKINVNLPFDHIENPEEFLSLEAVSEIGTLLERLGFNAGCVTDHPCPTGRWLDNGGHHAQDPFVMMSLLAGATTKLRVQTGILVLPYRNPFVVARAVSTLDVFSKGRVTLGFGAGYLKGEYRALGVDFEKRNELMDEYILAMKAAWSGEEFTFKGDGYEALGNRVLPAPIQRPHPPLLIGGNSKRAIRRAVELGDSWYPFFNTSGVSASTRTAEISSELDLNEGLVYMRAHSEKIGRQTPPALKLGSLIHPGDAWNAEALIEKYSRMKELGAIEASSNFDARTRAEWCDQAERFGKEVLAKLS